MAGGLFNWSWVWFFWPAISPAQNAQRAFSLPQTLNFPTSHLCVCGPRVCAIPHAHTSTNCYTVFLGRHKHTHTHSNSLRAIATARSCATIVKQEVNKQTHSQGSISAPPPIRPICVLYVTCDLCVKCQIEHSQSVTVIRLLNGI